MNKAIEEVLYSAMEDFVLDIVGKARAGCRLASLVGATTKMNLPLRAAPRPF